MSPILVRPVREQLEHDRVIRKLQDKYKRKFEVAINPGNEQSAPVGAGPSAWYPDLVLQGTDRTRKLAGVIEVETAESVNNLEARSQWAAFSKLRVPFLLYLPIASVDIARRFCVDFDIPVAEMWAYQWVGDQPRFTLVQRSPDAKDGKDLSVTTAPEPRPAVARPSKVAEPPRRAARPPTRRPAPAPAPAARARGASTNTRKPARPAASSASRRPAASSKQVARRAKPAKPAARGASKAARRPARPQKRR